MKRSNQVKPALADLIKGHDGRASLTKVGIVVFGIYALLELVVQHYAPVAQRPSDMLILGVLTIFVLKQAVDNSKLSNRVE